jgi:hypothetical protein
VALHRDTGTGLLLIEVALRQRAIVRHAGRIEQHLLPRWPVGHIGIALGDQRFDHRDHAGDMRGGARLMRRLKAAERLQIGMILRGGLFGDPRDRLVQRQIGKSRSARALILSSTSVMLRT